MKRIMLFTVSAALLFVGDTFASDKVESKEIREQKAKTHEEMATCLRSTKSVEECREAMNKAKEMAVMPEVREKEAKMHEEMATCLRSTKSIEDCREVMMKNCKEIKGEKMCKDMHGEKNKKM